MAAAEVDGVEALVDPDPGAGPEAAAQLPCGGVGRVAIRIKVHSVFYKGN